MKQSIQQMINHPIFKVCALLVVFVLISKGALAQPPDPGAEPNSAPIDGGLSLLVAAGVGYGAKKMREKRNKGLEIKN